MNTSVKKLFKNIAANQAGFLVSVVVTFFLSPFVVNSLGGTRYGIWTLIVSLTGNYGLLAFGIQGAMTRYIAHAAATNDRVRVNGYFNTALSFLLCSAALAIIVGLVISLLIDSIFVLPNDLVQDARAACILVTFSAAATFAFAAFDSLLVAHQRFQLTNAVGTFTTLIRAGMTVWILQQGYGIVGLAALGAGLTLSNGLMVAVITKKIYSWLILSLLLARRCYFKELINYGYKSFVVGVAVALVYQCDLLVIGTYLSPDKVTIYSLAATLITYLIQFISAIAFTLGPYVTELHAKDKADELREFFIKGSCLMYMLGGWVVAGCFMFGTAFYTLWVGPEYIESSAILTILVFPQFFAAGVRIGNSLLVGMNKIGILAVTAISEGVSNLIMSIVLVRHFGIIGVAIGTLVPLVITNALILPIYVCHVSGISAKTIYIKSMLPGILVCGASIFIGYLVSAMVVPNLWINFIIDIIIVTAVTLAISYFILVKTGMPITVRQVAKSSY